MKVGWDISMPDNKILRDFIFKKKKKRNVKIYLKPTIKLLNLNSPIQVLFVEVLWVISSKFLKI